MPPLRFNIPGQVGPNDKPRGSGSSNFSSSRRERQSVIAPLGQPPEVSIAPMPMNKEWDGEGEQSKSPQPPQMRRQSSIRPVHEARNKNRQSGRRQSTLITNFADTINALRAEISQRSKKPWYIIDPRSSTFMSYWDSSTAIALIFTAVVTPFEVAFLTGPLDPLSGLFIVNRLVDAIFVVDMILQFFVMYQRESDDMQAGAMGETSHWVRTRHAAVLSEAMRAA
jgi:hypothetical protein